MHRILFLIEIQKCKYALHCMVIIVGVCHRLSPMCRRWGESADQFDPNRPDLKTLCANDLVMTTFSHGIHKCPGSRITMMVSDIIDLSYVWAYLLTSVRRAQMMRLLIVVLLGKYELSVSSDQDIPPLSFKRATLAQRNGKCKVALKIVSQS